MHCSRVLNGLCSLVQPVIRTSPVEDPHPEQVEKDRIVDTSLIHLLEPFCPSDHVGPKMIIKVEVWVYVPPPLIVNNSLVVRLPHLPNAMECILGDLQFSISISFIGNKEGNYLKGQRVVTIA